MNQIVYLLLPSICNLVDYKKDLLQFKKH